MGSEISDENLELIDEIQNGSHDHNIIFSKYKSRRDYKWYHILFQCLLIPFFFGIMMLLETYWNIRKSKSSQSLVVYLEDEESIFQYQILDFNPFSVEKLFIDKKMKISWCHRPGSDGAVRPDADFYTIISSNDEKINFVATDGQKCNIKSFAEAKNIAIRKTHYMEGFYG